MYYLKFISISLFILLGLKMSTVDATRWVITKSCSLKVEGSTNVSQFSCIISNSFRPDTLIMRRSASSESTSINGYMSLNVQDFDCHNPMMTGELRKILKAKHFPNMTIRFISLNGYPDNRLKAYPINGLVSIELAGVTKNFNVAYMVWPTGKNTLVLKGIKEIKFSDFNIVPPRKIGGMIQTSDKLIAEFNLALQLIKD
ncbi:MAG: YceI family protein [Phormidesmis sp. FL-bin-119]|nr:YceI family protein [Pedobacter sp.]